MGRAKLVQFQGKVAVVTGAAQGIGAATARSLAAAGAGVAVFDLKVEEGESVAASIRRTGGRALFRRVDVTDEALYAQALAEVAQEFGGIDVLVSNAVSSVRIPLAELPLEGWQKTLNIGLTAAFIGAKHVYPYMSERRGGAIVNVASVHSFHAYPNFGAYGPAKAGVLALTRQLAQEYAPKQIRVNAVCPGLIMTEGNAHLWPPERMEKVLPLYPLGRVGRPQDVADAILYLASEQAGFITGVALPVDGGMVTQAADVTAFTPPVFPGPR